MIDPTLVTRSALEHAASIAKTVLVTECVVTRAASEDDLVREAREVNDRTHQIVHRPPREPEVRRRGARASCSPASTPSPTRSR